MVVVLLALLVGTASAGDPARGEVLAGLSGCAACHTAEDGPAYAGGHAIRSRFGTFYGSNLTPDPEHGIGRWSEADFVRAMREGMAPDGHPYWPAFPYPSFTRASDQDLADLWAFLGTLPAVARPDHANEVLPRYDSRALLGTWRTLSFRAGAWRDDPRRDAAWNRGAYLVTGLGHCGECHSPRSGIGVPKKGMELAGSDEPPAPAPNLTPHPDGLGGWSEDELIDFLRFGMTPEGDVVGGHMGTIIDLGTSRLSESDRRAIATYLRSLPARPSP